MLFPAILKTIIRVGSLRLTTVRAEFTCMAMAPRPTVRFGSVLGILIIHLLSILSSRSVKPI